MLNKIFLQISSEIRMWIMIIIMGFIQIMTVSCSAQITNSENMSFEDHYSKAEKYAESENYDEAIEEYIKALEIKPDSAKVHLALGFTYESKWRITFNEAQSKSLEEAFNDPSKHQKTIATLKDQDKIYEYYGEKREFKRLAIKEFNEVLKYDPNDWRALYMVATDHLNNGLYDEAIEKYKKTISVKPDYINSYVLIASAYSKKGLYEIAVSKYKDALNIDPNEQQAHYELGVVYLKLNKKKEAEKQLEILKELDSTFYSDLKARMDFYNR